MNPSTRRAVSVVTPGDGGLPRLTLAAPDGACAQIYVYGAHVVSWVPAGGQERLFLSRASSFQAGVPIRGGVPLVFPQFAGLGPLPLHGLVRLMPWELAAAHAAGHAAVAMFDVSDTENSRRLWPHAFLAELTVAIGSDRLALALGVTNMGADTFEFTAALHTYLAVDDIHTTTVQGLSGLLYRDSAAGGVELRDHMPHITFGGEVNRVYLDAPAQVRVVENGRGMVVNQSGFPDTVVWNPGAARCATMPDLEPDDFLRFVCVEAAAVKAPVRLAPGERWQGTQTLIEPVRR